MFLHQLNLFEFLSSVDWTFLDLDLKLSFFRDEMDLCIWYVSILKAMN